MAKEEENDKYKNINTKANTQGEASGSVFLLISQKPPVVSSHPLMPALLSIHQFFPSTPDRNYTQTYSLRCQPNRVPLRTTISH